ncbi:MAG: hypothetical protein BJ554DRAFT_8251, partial [Olpidium bornovanus]
MMYNMLTGIRIGVSRCQAKPQRALGPSDFKAAHKLAFDIMGSELTPSAKYDFKFKDYAPWVFRHLRECFRIDAADYLVSLTSKYILSELGSPGKSGSFFYYSSDYRFIIKTIHHSEHKFFRAILPSYYEHVRANPNTLISRFFGLHRVKLPHGRKVHFVVMGNVFPPNRDIHETYDLKVRLATGFFQLARTLDGGGPFVSEARLQRRAGGRRGRDQDESSLRDEGPRLAGTEPTTRVRAGEAPHFHRPDGEGRCATLVAQHH